MTTSAESVNRRRQAANDGRAPVSSTPERPLDEQKVDEFVEAACCAVYAETMGRPNLTPGMYFRLLLVGYFEDIDSEQWYRVARGGLARD